MDKTSTLTPEILHIVQDQGTESPGTGAYNLLDIDGSYLCRRCGLALFRSTDKFLSSCGWPSFDDEIADTLQRVPDKDGLRTEIFCARCDAHLGHVFHGEHITSKNLRHCINSLGLDFVQDEEVTDTEEAIYAGGCFWGVQYLFDQVPGVLLTEVGYTGGHHDHPTYREVCNGATGHVEAIRVLYDKDKIDYETLTRYFLEIHDPTQHDGQGPDIGDQYQSAIFYYNEEQQEVAQTLMDILEEYGFGIATVLKPTQTFWPAEEYHQKYDEKNDQIPYCHSRVKRF